MSDSPWALPGHMITPMASAAAFGLVLVGIAAVALHRHLGRPGPLPLIAAGLGAVSLGALGGLVGAWIAHGQRVVDLVWPPEEVRFLSNEQLQMLVAAPRWARLLLVMILVAAAVAWAAGRRSRGR